MKERERERERTKKDRESRLREITARARFFFDAPKRERESAVFWSKLSDRKRPSMIRMMSVVFWSRAAVDVDGLDREGLKGDSLWMII